MRILLFISFFGIFNKNWAQSDSMGYFDVYKNEVQQTLNPALVADMGKHFVRSDFRMNRNNISNNNNLIYWQAAYHNQWRKHGFGIVSKNIPFSQLIYSNSIGLQYAYGFGLGKSNFWKNTKLNIGTELNFTQMKNNFDDYVFIDQLDSLGIIRPTQENSGSEAILYPSINIGIALRSKKFYLVSGFYNLNRATEGFYSTQSSKQEIKIDIQAGAKLFEVKQVSSWLVIDLPMAGSYQQLGKIGLALSYKHLIVTYKITEPTNHFFQLSYIHPRVRLYAQYQKIKHPYIIYSNMSAGIAFGITKQ